MKDCKKEQNWEIKYDGKSTRVFINGTEIKHLKSIKFEHTVGAEGYRDLPILEIKIFATNSIEENTEDTIRVMTLDSNNPIGEHFSKI